MANGSWQTLGGSGGIAVVDSATAMFALTATDGLQVLRTDVGDKPGAIYEYDSTQALWMRVHNTPRRLVGRRIVNASGASTSVLIAPPGRRLYGGMLVATGAVDVTVRDGHLVTSDIIQIRPGAAAGDARITPIEVRGGLYATIANNATVTFFFSDAADTLPGAMRPTELTPNVIASDGVQTLPLSASGRAWLGPGVYNGFSLTSQTVAGVINVYDGWTNAAELIDTIAVPAVGFRGGSGDMKFPIEVRKGLFVELLGTAQVITLTTGAMK